MTLVRKAGFALAGIFACALLFQNCARLRPSVANLAASTAPSPLAHTPALFNVRDFGAKGDGAQDDTSAIQATINFAQTKGGGIVLIPAGNFKINGTLSITSGVSIRGAGHQLPLSTINDPSSVPPISIGDFTAACSCLIQTGTNATTFHAVTTDAVQFQNLVIYYMTPPAPLSGATGIAIDGGDGQGNSQSLIRSVFIYGADRAISMNNSVSYVVANNILYNSGSFGFLQLSSDQGVAASTGDWQVTQNTFKATTSAVSAHIKLASGGGGRIDGNRMIGTGAGYGILIAPDRFITGGYTIEPPVITNNSIYAVDKGIAFIGSPLTGNATAAQGGQAEEGVFAGNQVWAATPLYAMPYAYDSANHGLPWIVMWSISGNILNCTGDSAHAALDGDTSSMKGVLISGNSIYLGSAGCQVSRLATSSATMTSVANSTQPGLYTGQISTGASSQTLTSAWISLVNAQAVFNVVDFGAKGDSSNDDSGSIQSAIDAAISAHGTVFIPAGRYRISKPLNVGGSVVIHGVGYQSSGNNYSTLFNNGAPPDFALSEVRNCSCIIQTALDASILSVNTTQAVTVESLEMYFAPNGQTYPTPFKGASGIMLQGGNKSSVMRDLFIYGADRGIYLDNASGWLIENVTVYNALTYAVYMTSPPDANAGDWTIRNNTFESDSVAAYSHILIASTGNGVIQTNKLNAAGSGLAPVRNGVAIAPIANSGTAQYDLGTITIVGNSIEGANVGIAFTGAPGNNAVSTSGVLKGNQIWATKSVVVSPGSQVPTWVKNWQILQNVFHHSDVALDLNGASGISIGENTIANDNSPPNALLIGSQSDASTIQMGANNLIY